jgi:hypothetical protein
MRLDRILQALLPHHDHFFDMFEEAARTVHSLDFLPFRA